MFARRMIPVALFTTMALVIPVRAQSVQPTKVAVANTAMIFSQMQETKDLTVKLNNDARTLNAEDQRRKTELENFRSTRDQFKPDSSQWTDANQKYLKAAVDYRSWQELTQLDLTRQQKLQTKQIFDEIRAACQDIAKQMGYDLVVAQQSPELVNSIEDPNVNINQFRLLVTQYNVLYASSTVDITDKVVAALDAKYKSTNPAPPAK